MHKDIHRQSNIAVSAALNIVRKACMIAFPLITYSYATRVLGTKGIGIYEFSQSIVSYFALVAALGINQYAVRDGAAYLKTDKLSDFASEVFSINMVMTFISYIVMIVLLNCNSLLRGYRVAILISSLTILFTTLGVDWINSLFEDYLYLTIRYIAIQIIAIVALLIFVRRPEDIYKYIFVSIFATVVNGVLNFIYIQKYVSVRFTFHLNIAKHGLPIFILFCNNIASVIYLNSDVTILRILTDDDNVGLYGVASKVYTMIKELMNAAIFVTIPRFSGYVAAMNEQEDNSKGKNISSEEHLLRENHELTDKYLSGIKSLFTALFTVLVPACIGLLLLSKDVMYIIAGEAFAGGAVALRILAVAMFFAVSACFLAYAIIMPYKLEKYFLVATSIAATVNIVLNFVLIPIMGMPAAAYTTLLAEILVFTILFWVANKKVRLLAIMSLRDVTSVAIGSIVIAVICMGYNRLLQLVTGNMRILCVLVLVTIAVLSYAGLLLMLKNSAVETLTGMVKVKINKNKG